MISNLWTLETIHAALTDETLILENVVKFGLFQLEDFVGVGIGRSHSIVLMVPEDPTAQPINDTEAFEYRPSCAVTTDTGQVISGVSLVILRFPNLSDSELTILSLIVKSLSDLAHGRRGDLRIGTLVHSLKNFLISRFEVVRPKELIGLIGELLVILAATNSDLMAESWHLRITSDYDFSHGSERIEVKTANGHSRKHHFSSNQLPAPKGVNLAIASVLLYEAFDASSLIAILRDLEKRVSQTNMIKIRALCTQTLGMPPELVISPSFDVAASKNSIRLFSADEVPTPIKTIGVQGMEWWAELYEPISTPTGRLAALFQA